MIRILEIPRLTLRGLASFKLQGSTQNAIELLQKSVQAYTDLEFDEPPGWMISPRQPLGALLLQSGDVSQAMEVFNEDLKESPANVWSLTGLKQCLVHQKATAAEIAKIDSRIFEACPDMLASTISTSFYM